MKKGDKYKFTRPLSNIIDAVMLLDEEPDLEYLLRCRDLVTGKVRFINKKIIETKWKKFKRNIQYSVFTVDRTQLYKNAFKHLKLK